MQLYGSTRSPFVRKVLVAAKELDLDETMELVPVVVSSTSTDEHLVSLNPLGQIPTLLLGDGAVIHDSLIICEYLDVLAGGNRLLPTAGPARWQVLTNHSLGQGMLETLVRLFSERKRVGDPRHPVVVEALAAKFHRAVSGLNARGLAKPGPFDLGDIAIGCALSYADFRLPQQNWREGHAELAAYFADISARPSMVATAYSGAATE
jgi:glutathione S-transferase